MWCPWPISPSKAVAHVPLVKIPLTSQYTAVFYGTCVPPDSSTSQITVGEQVAADLDLVRVDPGSFTAWSTMFVAIRIPGDAPPMSR